MGRVRLRARALARRRHRLKYTTRKCYTAELERRFDKAMARQPTNKHGKRLRKRYGKGRGKGP